MSKTVLYSIVMVYFVRTSCYVNSMYVNVIEDVTASLFQADIYCNDTHNSAFGRRIDEFLCWSADAWMWQY